MFLLQATPAHPIDIDALRAHFEDLGESVLVAGDSAYYVGGVHHRWWAADSGTYRLVVVKQGLRAGATDSR